MGCLATYFLNLVPVETALLTSAIKPFIDTPKHKPIKGVDVLRVTAYTIVPKVP